LIRAILLSLVVAVAWWDYNPQAGLAALTTGLAAGMIGWLAREEKERARGRS